MCSLSSRSLVGDEKLRPHASTTHPIIPRPRPSLLRFYRDVIVPDALDRGKAVLIASSENAIRGLLMHLCDIPTARIAELEIPTGVPIVFDFDARCVKLLDDGRLPSPRERYDFGPAGEHLFLDDDDGGLVRLPSDEEAAPGEMPVTSEL